MPENYHIIVEEGEQKNRIDKFISMKIPDISRNRVQSLIEEGNISHGSSTLTDRSYKVKIGDEFSITIPDAEEPTMVANNIPLNIAYEDDHLLVIDKPAGLTTHPGAGNQDNTLANALLYHCGDSLSGIGGVMRPGIVHRLDKDTSGLLVVAKHDKSHRKLAKQIETRELKRVYNAIIWGVMIPPAGKISANIGRSPRDRKKMAVLKDSGKEAVTHYKILEVYPGKTASLVECRLETGRTHQIRVHLTHKGFPIIGDQDYGKNKAKNYDYLSEESAEFVKNFPRQALHSTYMSFTHPENEEFMEFSSDMPADMTDLVKHLTK